MLGLPRPGGALTRKARALGAPVLLSANAFAIYARRSSSAEPRRFLRFNERLLAHLDGIDEVVLDSAGFVCHRLMERFPWPADAYVAFASNPRFKRWSSLDFACELEIAQTPEVVFDRISQSTRMNFVCARLADKYGSRERFMPVIQSGADPTGYLRSIEQLEGLLYPGIHIGVGSMCRRPIHSPTGALRAATLIAQRLPEATFHYFGLKSGGLSALSGVRDGCTADSQAYGVAARQEAFKAGHAKPDWWVAEIAEDWWRRQLAEASRFVTASIPSFDIAEGLCAPPGPTDRLARAREQVRQLVRDGDLPLYANHEWWAWQLYADSADDGDDDVIAAVSAHPCLAPASVGA